MWAKIGLTKLRDFKGYWDHCLSPSIILYVKNKKIKNRFLKPKRISQRLLYFNKTFEVLPSLSKVINSSKNNNVIWCNKKNLRKLQISMTYLSYYNTKCHKFPFLFTKTIFSLSCHWHFLFILLVILLVRTVSM